MISKALYQSIIDAPPLLDDLPEGGVFPCQSLELPPEVAPLNFEQKLGHLYEDALAALLAATPQYGQFVQGVQIREKAGRTLGELDFLVKDLTSGRLIHLELAVKFYLAVETKERTLLPGPDARDHYFRKLERMQSHQLGLAHKHRGLLPENFRGQEIVVQQLVHGCIFNHIHARKPVEAEFLNPEGRRGKWLHAKECHGYFGTGALLEVIPKPLWPVPLTMIEKIKLQKWRPENHIDRCVMVRSETGGSPYFIAPNDYPTISEACRENATDDIQGCRPGFQQ